MTMIPFDAIGPTDPQPRRIMLDPASIESVEEHIAKTNHEGTCLVQSKNGRSYIVRGDFSAVSKRIAPIATRFDKVKAFLNSSLGIFVLTTIFVTLGGAALKWSAEQAANRFAAHAKRISRERSLLVEFDTRVAQMSAREDQINEFTKDDDKGSATLCIYNLAAGTGICDSTNMAKGRPLLAILSELTGLGVKTDQKNARTILGQIETEHGEKLNSANMRVYPAGVLEDRLSGLRLYSRRAWNEVGHS